MYEKEILGRVVLKHDITENWEKAVNFSPKKGELIAYDDKKNLKLGNGTSNVNNLPFLIPNSDDFLHFTQFPQNTQIPNLVSGNYYYGESNAVSVTDDEIDTYSLYCYITNNNNKDIFVSYFNNSSLKIDFNWSIDEGEIIKTGAFEALNPFEAGFYKITFGNNKVYINDYSPKSFYTKEEVNNLVSLIPKFTIEYVSELPTENISETTIYLVSNSNVTDSENWFTEYINIWGTWEKLGSQSMSLADYVTKDTTELSNYDLSTVVNAKIQERVFTKKVPPEVTLTNDYSQYEIPITMSGSEIVHLWSIVTNESRTWDLYFKWDYYDDTYTYPMSVSVRVNSNEEILKSFTVPYKGTVHYRFTNDYNDTYRLDYCGEKVSNISQLNNDTGYIDASALSPYAKTEDIPTNLSDLVDDMGFVLPPQVEEIVNNMTLTTSITKVNSSSMVFVENTIYSHEVDSSTTSINYSFVPPTDSTVQNQILIYLKTNAATSISWGDNVAFVGDEIANIAIGTYRIIAEWNPIYNSIGAWIIGVIQDGPEGGLS